VRFVIFHIRLLLGKCNFSYPLVRFLGNILPATSVHLWPRFPLAMWPLLITSDWISALCRALCQLGILIRMHCAAGPLNFNLLHHFGSLWLHPVALFITHPVRMRHCCAADGFRYLGRIPGSGIRIPWRQPRRTERLCKCKCNSRPWNYQRLGHRQQEMENQMMGGVKCKSFWAQPPNAFDIVIWFCGLQVQMRRPSPMWSAGGAGYCGSEL